MAKPKLGAKRRCPKCDKSFYDLERRPAACPACAHEFDPDAPAAPTRAQAKSDEPEDEGGEETASDDDAEDGDGFEDEPETVAEIDPEKATISGGGDGDDDDDDGDDEVDDLDDDFIDDEDEDDEENSDDNMPFLDDDDDEDPEAALGVATKKDEED